jgi:hypothetical protein
MPAWPGLRCADLIEAALRELDQPERDAVLHALAQVLDRYLAAMPGCPRPQVAIGLDAALDEVLRLLPPMIGSKRARG